jgi:16S rRNA (uracil1498-N3)-methyltransferase
MRVLRLGAGDRCLGITNCSGEWWELAIHPDLQQAIVVGVVKNDRELGIELELAIVLLKGNHLEAVIPPAVELGVTCITPLFSDRCTVKPVHPPSSHKQQRWQRLAQEASELSLRSRVPTVQSPIVFTEFLANCASTHRFMGVTGMASHLHRVCQDRYPLTGTVTMTIGCEGGWTPDEEQTALDYGFIPVSLGDRVLSATTAPVVALAMINSAMECPP